MYQNIFVKASTNEVWIWDDKKGVQNFTYTPYAYRKDPNGKFQSIYGDKLIKVKNFTKNDPDLLESDIPEATRILVDKYNDSDLPSEGIVTMILDIEVEMISGVPDPMVADNEITSIAYHDSVTQDYTVLILDKKKQVKSSTIGNRTIISCGDEKTLLLKFIQALRDVNPHIISGWNTDKFDIPFIYNRLKKLLGKKIADSMSPIGHVFYSPYRERYTLGGISVLDYMLLYKKFSYKELPSYSLNSISLIELERSKLEYEGNLDDLMENDIQTFIEYNITDVELVLEIDKKLQYIELIRGICHICHVPYEDFFYSSKYLEGAVLTYLRRINVVAPNKPQGWREKIDALKASGDDGFIGAYVKDPIPGKYDWIYDLDLTSLYPSIIMTLNISPETKVGKIMNWDAEAFIRGTIDEYIINGEIVSKEKLQAFLSRYNYSVASNGVIYRTDVNGLIPSILNDWFDKRVEYKDEMKKWGKAGDTDKYEFYKKRQLIQKILLNSMYGVLGLPAFRFYDLDNAEAVTLTGQTVIKKTQDAINHKYNSELKTTNVDYIQYVDTDSVFVSCAPLVRNRFPDIDANDVGSMTKKIYEIATEVQNYVNSFYDIFAKKFFNVVSHRLEIKQEMIARSGFWAKKKRYALWIISDNGVAIDKLEVKGLDVVRSSFPRSFQKFMKQLLVDILESKDKSLIDESILSFKRNLTKVLFLEVAKNSSIKNIEKYEAPIKTEVMGTFVKGTPFHVKSAIVYNKLLKLYNAPNKYPPIKNGDKIKITYLKNNKYGISAIAFRGDNDPPEIIDFIKEHFDAKSLFASELDKKIKGFYAALNWEDPSPYKKTMEKFFDFE